MSVISDGILERHIRCTASGGFAAFENEMAGLDLTGERVEVVGYEPRGAIVAAVLNSAP